MTHRRVAPPRSPATQRPSRPSYDGLVSLSPNARQLVAGGAPPPGQVPTVATDRRELLAVPRLRQLDPARLDPRQRCCARLRAPARRTVVAEPVRVDAGEGAALAQQHQRGRRGRGRAVVQVGQRRQRLPQARQVELSTVDPQRDLVDGRELDLQQRGQELRPHRPAQYGVRGQRPDGEVDRGPTGLHRHRRHRQLRAQRHTRRHRAAQVVRNGVELGAGQRGRQARGDREPSPVGDEGALDRVDVADAERAVDALHVILRSARARSPWARTRSATVPPPW